MKYRPSNGTEGDHFRAQFCDRCARERFDENQEMIEVCLILSVTLMMDDDDPNYPKEWICDDDGSNPRCTAFLDSSHREKLERQQTLKELDKSEEAWNKACKTV